MKFQVCDDFENTTVWYLVQYKNQHLKKASVPLFGSTHDGLLKIVGKASKIQSHQRRRDVRNAFDVLFGPRWCCISASFCYQTCVEVRMSVPGRLSPTKQPACFMHFLDTYFSQQKAWIVPWAQNEYQKHTRVNEWSITMPLTRRVKNWQN